ncbi:MAG: helix-turn-helix transcriptional regulator [Pseudomonadota bacterium]
MPDYSLQLEPLAASAVVGMSILAITLLADRAGKQQWLWPLVVFFGANLVTEIGPLVAPFGPNVAVIADVIYFPHMMLLGPTLWLYVVALTATERWRWRWPGWRHAIPIAYAVVLATVILMLPNEGRLRLLSDDYPGPNTLFLNVLAMLGMLLVLVWFVQTAIYIVLIVRRLIHYRARLRDIFASTRQRELSWIVWVLVLLVFSWVWLLLNTLFDAATQTRVGELIDAAVSTLLVYILAIWGLRQHPGFEHHYSEAAQDAVSTQTTKYERSALQEADAVRIAGKIEQAMSAAALYREPNLSLGDLSARIGVTPNYVSQTLNETLSSSFFDYVNRWRVQEAMPLVAAGKRTVVDIANAVGFNSRSAFYKAFRNATGMTPSAYRNAQRAGNEPAKQSVPRDTQDQ